MHLVHFYCGVLRWYYVYYRLLSPPPFYTLNLSVPICLFSLSPPLCLALSRLVCLSVPADFHEYYTTTTILKHMYIRI
jgi:hypothetical protein